MESEDILKQRKEKAFSFFKKNYNLVSYIILAIIVFVSVRIRTRNIPGLRDISTNSWTLGPDLDPFLFLRWAKYIVENGSLFTIDKFRYFPLGLSTQEEYLLHPYMIAWFHELASLFGSESITYSAVIYPVFFFALALIAFFFLVRILFVESQGAAKANIIALVSTLFLSVLPSILPRTIAGIPEKESAAFFFMFAAFYFFIKSWRSKNRKKIYLFGILAGAFTAGMASVWGGFIYIFSTIGLSVLIAFLLGKTNRLRLESYGAWILSSTIFILALPFSPQSLANLSTSITTGVAYLALFILIVDLALNKTRLSHNAHLKKIKQRLGSPVTSLIVAVILGGVLSSLFFGPGFLLDKASDATSTLVKPAQSRLIQTVAENRQPYFNEWSNSFGPQVRGVPIFFWLFILGSIYLFYRSVNFLSKKEKSYLVFGYVLLLASIIFSRYRADSILNGENSISTLFYFGGILVSVAIFAFVYYNLRKNENLHKLKSISFGHLFVIVFFLFSVLSARSAVRLILMLDIPSSIIVAFLAVVFVSNVYQKNKSKENATKFFAWALAGIIILALAFSAYSFYNISDSTARSYVPSVYTQQWQGAMSWVRGNTAESSVFSHWWDYGYWVQSIGERATVLDGGNNIGYWNHLMGRYALTGPSSKEAAEFLYPHNVTHFLIDSTDIGKYTAFSTIGSDESLDRRSWINTFFRDNSQALQRKNSTVFLYRGGAAIDGDIVYKNGSEEIFIPGVEASSISSGISGALGAVEVEISPEGVISQPYGIYVYGSNQYRLPLRYAFYNNELIDFESGVNAGAFFMPRINQDGGSLNIEENGVLLYLSQRTVNSQLARLYLYGEDNEYFALAHEQDDIIVSQIKSQIPNIQSIVYFRGLRGPIKIWEVSYPEIDYKGEFLETRYPDSLRS